MRVPRTISLAPFILTLVASSHAGPPPRVVSSIPADGTQDVPVDIGKIVIVFDRTMRTTSHTLVEVKGVTFPPVVYDDDPWQDPLTFVIRLQRLQPATTYAIQLNTERRTGFASSRDQTPLPPTRLSFRTAGSSSPSSTAPPCVSQGSVKGAHQPIVYRRMWEPRERAFWLLAPDGWKIECTTWTRCRRMGLAIPSSQSAT